MKTFRFWLLTLAAIATTAPFGAAQTNASEPQWKRDAAAPVEESAIVNWPRLAGDADSVAAQGQQLPAPAQNGPGQAGSGSQPASSSQLDPPSATPSGATSPTSPAPASTDQPAVSPANQQNEQEQDQRKKAEQQMKEQEHQRVLGIVPSFNVTYRSDAVSLTSGQKMRLAFRTTIDWATVAGAFGIAGYHEVANDLTGFSWGPKGYFERVGAAYLDTFNGTMIGNGILPSLLHQDPRYFRLGHGSFAHRFLYAASAAVICKHDNTGKWEPNYSNVGGNIIAGAISNLYYPGNNSGVGLTISNGMIQTAEGAIGGIFQEFWPDISKKWFHKDPTRGLQPPGGDGQPVDKQ